MKQALQDALLSIGNQIDGLMKSDAQAKMSAPPAKQIADGINTGITAVMGPGSGEPPTASSGGVLVNSAAGEAVNTAPGTGVSGAGSGAPSNAILSDGNSGDDVSPSSQAANSATSGAASGFDTSITSPGSEFLNVQTDVTAEQFQSNLMSNGYSVTSQGTGKNGAFTVLSDGSSTYTVYTRSSTGSAGAQYFGPGGASVKFSLKGQ
jgi:filamentous hemagglutinin